MGAASTELEVRISERSPNIPSTVDRMALILLALLFAGVDGLNFTGMQRIALGGFGATPATTNACGHNSGSLPNLQSEEYVAIGCLNSLYQSITAAVCESLSPLPRPQFGWCALTEQVPKAIQQSLSQYAATAVVSGSGCNDVSPEGDPDVVPGSFVSGNGGISSSSICKSSYVAGDL